MKKQLLFIFSCLFASLTYGQVVINEVDADTPGQDMMEFVELYAPNMTSLDGHVLVFLNGSNSTVYNAIDLTGSSITDGFFVIGNSGVANVDLTFDNDGLQNGADAVALYEGVLGDFATGTELSMITNTLVDVVVYGTNDSDATALLALLDSSEGCNVQLNEDANGGSEGDVESSARVPDGGMPLCALGFVQQTPSPGESNIPSCFGGSLAFNDQSTVFTFCIDDDAIELIDYAVTDNIGENFLYIITDENDIILSTSNGETIDSNTLTEGVCRIHGISYNGTVDPETLAAGEDAVDIFTDGDCLSFASNYLTIVRNVCNPDCDGGTVIGSLPSGSIICTAEEGDVVMLSHITLASDANYIYVVTDADNVIVGVADNDPSFYDAPEGDYRVWGVSYTGEVDLAEFEEGQPLFGISSTECLDISSDFLEYTVTECAAVEGCGGIFFSEYVEGTSNNKALEIYNPTQFPVSLSDYQLGNCSNGCADINEWDFTPFPLGDQVIQPGGTFLLVHQAAAQELLDIADLTTANLSNGDDYYALQQISSMEILDAIGEATLEDIGDGWTVSGVENGTQNHTLVRMMSINEGNPDWSTAQNEWEVLDVDVFENLGSHTIIPCSVNNDPTVFFTVGGVSVDEGVGSVSIEVSILNPIDEEMTVEVGLTGGSAESPIDFNGTLFPVTLTFPAGMEEPQSFNVDIVDDMMGEGMETIILELMNPSEGVELGVSEFTLTINPSDVVIPVLDIAEVTGLDDQGVAESIGLECELRGVVYGVNYRPSGLQFTLIDPTDGIGVFFFEPVSDYTVNEGDSIHMVGTIDQYAGLTQIEPTSITLISSGNELQDPEVVTALGEDTESEFIQIACVELVNSAEWTNDGDFNVEITDGTNTYTMRIDQDTDVHGTDAPEGVFTVTGLGGQFDNSAPHDEGYQIFPRYIQDVPEGITGGFSLNETNSTGVLDGGGGDLFETEGPGSIAYFEGEDEELDYMWTFSGNTTTENFLELTLEEEWNGEPQELLVVASDGTCSVSVSSQLTFVWLGVEELEELNLLVYPNPVTEILFIEVPHRAALKIVNVSGQEVYEKNNADSGILEINVSEFTAGLYFIEIVSNDGVQRAPFMKE